MRVSQLLLPTVKEDPAGAEAVSHKLMVRAGLVRQLAAGIYVYLPAGWRVMQKIEQIIREEMDAIGCQEMLMPVMQPAEIWQESGRWDAIGDEMFRLKDRKGADMALAMTHEEVVTWLAAREVHSYKQLPQLWYHFQTKERDEARPKSGILRTREFIMKDSYSLDVSEEALQESYRLHIGAYDRIYARCGLDFMMVEGDSGMMGGADQPRVHGVRRRRRGRDRLLPRVRLRLQRRDGRRRRRPRAAGERARAARRRRRAVRRRPPARRSTCSRRPSSTRRTRRPIEQVAAYLGLPARAFVKALVVVPEGGGEAGEGGAAAASGPVMVLVRGDHELGELKLRKALGAEFRMATADEVLAAQGVEPGFVGPVPTPLPVFADEALRRGHYVAGANKAGFHRSGVTLEQVPQADVHRPARRAPGRPVRAVLPASSRARASSRSATSSSSASSTRCPWARRSWTRTARSGPSSWAATASASRASPPRPSSSTTTTTASAGRPSIAPFQVHLVLVRASDETQRSSPTTCTRSSAPAGIEVVYDDRDMSPGIKFKDADLLGCPVQVVVGKRAGEGFVELKERDGGERRDVPVADLAASIAEVLALV